MTSKPNNEAQKTWLAIPADIREKLLGNVFCGQCGEVTIRDFEMYLEGNCLILKGFCSECGHSVARVIEDCRKGPETAGNKTKVDRSPKGQKKDKTPRNYIFNVWFAGRGDRCDFEGKVSRIIRIDGLKNLYTFAKVITKAFNFNFDHCFGFYDNFERYGDSKMSYELFVDVGEAPETPICKGVKSIKIRQVFKEPGDKRLFLFDYGDGWCFRVELKEIVDAERGALKPKVLQKIGKAPQQYPPCEEKEYK